MRLILAVLLLTSASVAVRMGKNVVFQLEGETTQTFESDPAREVRVDEVLKVQLSPIGLKGERPSLKTPVWLYISARDDRHHWVMPWQPGGGHIYQWLEVLLCHNERSLELMAVTNATMPLPMRWRVSTENVKLGERVTTMKSTPADVSYRRFSWADVEAKAVDLEVSTFRGGDECAALAVARRCVIHPHQLTDDHLLQRIHFARSAKLSVSRADAPDGFWLYLIPEADNRRCAATAHRKPSKLPPAAKTIRVSAQTRTYELSGPTPQPVVDELPVGDSLAGGDGGGWAQSPLSECQDNLLQCEQRCPSG
ncbi:uncharacterized protein LOC122377905 [Amphibalanus amphitrite]|nr:uncharacterized protein LOC122377905 [Amphibalanus amphitrite]